MYIVQILERLGFLREAGWTLWGRIESHGTQNRVAPFSYFICSGFGLSNQWACNVFYVMPFSHRIAPLRSSFKEFLKGVFWRSFVHIDFSSFKEIFWRSLLLEDAFPCWTSFSTSFGMRRGGRAAGHMKTHFFYHYWVKKWNRNRNEQHCKCQLLLPRL